MWTQSRRRVWSEHVARRPDATRERRGVASARAHEPASRWSRDSFRSGQRFHRADQPVQGQGARSCRCVAAARLRQLLAQAQRRVLKPKGVTVGTGLLSRGDRVPTRPLGLTRRSGGLIATHNVKLHEADVRRARPAFAAETQRRTAARLRALDLEVLMMRDRAGGAIDQHKFSTRRSTTLERLRARSMGQFRRAHITKLRGRWSVGEGPTGRTRSDPYDSSCPGQDHGPLSPALTNGPAGHVPLVLPNRSRVPVLQPLSR